MHTSVVTCDSQGKLHSLFDGTDPRSAFFLSRFGPGL